MTSETKLDTSGNSLQLVLEQSEPISLDVKLQCEAGKMIALTGPSGSGKTTVLRSIAGLDKVARQRILCNGETWASSADGIHRSPQQRRAGLMFQDYALFPHLSAADNIAIAMQHVPRASRASRTEQLLITTNMQGLGKRKPHTLSGGQQQRIALARALARDPSVLLLDEPFAAVDQQTRRKLYRELSQLRAQLSIPIVLVTHDINEVQQLCDSICLIHRGKTLQSGTVDEVIQRPATRQIAKLLGFQNIVDASVRQHTDQYSLFGVGTVLLKGPKTADPPGSDVSLLIPPSAIVLHRADKPSRGEAENPVTGTIANAVSLGDEISVRMYLDDIEKSLRFRISRHVAQRNDLVAGSKITVSLKSDSMHVMR